MTIDGTAAYDGISDLPPLVAAAVAAAREAGFASTCLPEQGRLLQVLAGGVGAGRIGETGTGHGAGLAWLASGAHPQAQLFSIERDPGRCRAAQLLFKGDPRVHVTGGDWSGLAADGRYDLLVLDGGGQGKGAEPPLDPGAWLRPGGLVVLDDFTPMTTWPPRIDGQPDHARLYWLDHPRLRTTEIRVTPTAATLVGVYLQ